MPIPSGFMWEAIALYWNRVNDYKKEFQSQTNEQIRDYLDNRTIYEKIVSIASVVLPISKHYAKKTAAKEVLEERLHN